ncbi:glycosyltransferase family 2 protein [Tenacibaculum sp. UWU-22]|uniref:glycosyltransferase family 2 protein n=1 Tax=Tenacibaculum sp. UWU-22 TaxID=3234187 RepID=UPI0034DB1043
MAQLTVIITTLNEESNIQRVLDSVFFADEIIVVDSFSTDKTVDIIKKNKVRLLQRKFDNFSAQKNYAIKKALHDWILVVDADEVVTDQLRQSIVKAIEKPANFLAFKVYRKNFVKDKKLVFGGFTDKIIRLFKKQQSIYQGIVHEKIVVDGKVGFLKGNLNHYTYQSAIQFKNKLNYYAKLRAIELFKSNKKVNMYHIYVKPAARFCIHFFLKFGFLDGKNGLLFSYFMAYGVAKRFDSLITLQQLKNEDRI